MAGGEQAACRYPPKHSEVFKENKLLAPLRDEAIDSITEAKHGKINFSILGAFMNLFFSTTRKLNCELGNGKKKLKTKQRVGETRNRGIKLFRYHFSLCLEMQTTKTSFAK